MTMRDEIARSSSDARPASWRRPNANAGRDLVREREIQVGEIEAAGQHAERRHDDVFHERVTILPKAAPIMTPTARSTAFPLIANSLNSLNMVSDHSRSRRR